MTRKLRIGFFIFGTVGLFGVALAQGPATYRSARDTPAPIEFEAEPFSTGWQIVLDNDALVSPVSGPRDRDYSGGFAVALGGSRVANYRISLDPALTWMNKKIHLHGGRQHATADHLMQFGLTLFTPRLDSADDPAPDDRPFANLLFLANSQYFIDEISDRAYQSTLAIGILGSKVGEAAQKGVHRLSGLSVNDGYGRQVSDGGELTALYAVSRQSLLLSRNTGRSNSADVKYRVEGDIGYITEGSVALAARWGRVESPWWAFAPTRSNYVPQPIPITRHKSRGSDARDFFVWSAITIRARAYNALLQGQFRDSDVTFSGGELNHVVGELSFGLNRTFSNAVDVSFALHYQTHEIKRGTGSRNIRWGGLTFRKLL
ncbi:MAG: lipid A-modifier LpxR family protein [Woeseia sp.]